MPTLKNAVTLSLGNLAIELSATRVLEVGNEAHQWTEELPVNLHYTRLELVLESRDILRLIRIDAVAAKTGWNL